MIYVRDDDVLIQSSSFKDPFKHFQTVHGWMCETDKVLHVPAILVTEIQEFPECIEFIKQETAKGRMRPEIHGLRHIDYGKLPNEEVRNHLVQCINFIEDNFDSAPAKWYTPWGASQPHLHEVAKELKLELVDCSAINKLAGRYGIIQRMKDGVNLRKLEEQEIFFHWWEGGVRLKRAIEVIKHGSWAAAKAANGDWFE